jgi:hypothetical protein
MCSLCEKYKNDPGLWEFYHHELESAMRGHTGQILKAANIKEIALRQYPHLKENWILPSDHSLNHKASVKKSCWCAFVDSECQPHAIFEQIRRGYYRIL